jgi:general secretion pathway protein A
MLAPPSAFILQKPPHKDDPMNLPSCDETVPALAVFDHEIPDPFISLAHTSRPITVANEPPAPFSVPRNFLEYYGLANNPFADCVNPGFFYRTQAHSEALRSVTLAVEFETSVGLLTGPSGMGKTLVSQLLLQQLDPAKYCAALVLVTPGLGKCGLLREILSELSVALPVGPPRVQDLVKILSNQIIDLHREGKRLVLIIDESHFLSAECLHIVRTISNIEIPACKLVTCLLFGEERLNHRLDHPSYESLRNRIYLRGSLPCLGLEDTVQYVKYRLMVANRMPELFTPEALAAIHRLSGGICRSINKLAMLSLIEGAVRQLPILDEPLIVSCSVRM